jgi:hypothetical protein
MDQITSTDAADIDGDRGVTGRGSAEGGVCGGNLIHQVNLAEDCETGV